MNRILSLSSHSTMATIICATKPFVLPLIAPPKSTVLYSIPISTTLISSRFNSLKVKATESDNETKKKKTLVCPDCEGNGAKLCSQCEGTGKNKVDCFNGEFKAGALCWLCSGKRDVLCGNCNGAGFLGGFMSSLDETSS